MKKIKWGIVSTGRIANEFVSDFRFVNNGEVIAVASRDKEKAIEFAKRHGVATAYGSYEELYKDEDVEAIYVATPHVIHARNTIDALKNGKSVLCEKPITLGVNEFEEVKEVALSGGKLLMEGMWTYFLPAIQQALVWVKAGRIGKIKHVKANFGFMASFDPQGRLFNPDLGGGALYDVGIYPLALCWLLFEKDPKVHFVKAEMSTTHVDQDVVMLLGYGDCTASLHCSIAYQLHNHAIIAGEKGYIRIPNFWQAKECMLYAGRDESPTEHFKDERKSIGFNFEIEAFNAGLLAGNANCSTMPLEYSEKLQLHIAEVMKSF